MYSRHLLEKVSFFALYCRMVASLFPATTIPRRQSSLVSSQQYPSSSILLTTTTRLNLNANSSDDDDDDETYIDSKLISMTSSSTSSLPRREMLINTLALGLLAASGVASTRLFRDTLYAPPGFQRLATTQFIAALGDPKASSGYNASKEWGVWSVDPGPRGVWLRDYESNLQQHNNVAPIYGWTFNPNDWWLEEHGLIMESPTFPIQPGRYLVTGFRDVTTGLTIAADGSWKLDKGTLYDVTHLPCRAARYHPQSTSTVAGGEGRVVGGPQTARLTDFPVRPGAEMPTVPGCDKQDYAVLFMIGKATSDGASSKQ